jgi:hypothetical protein
MPGMPIVILGMHRSGTSAVTGMLEEQGIDLGPVRRKSNPHQPRGNRENPKVFKLDERVLAYNDGSWHSPPARRIRFTRRQLERRNRVLSAYESEPFAIKDPRMLLLLDFWRDLLERPIGVIRNPVSVMRSLRARGGPAADLSDDEHLGLWKTYNGALLDARREREFPVIDFERREALPEQVAAALAHYGLNFESGSFFEPGSIRHEGGDWRTRPGPRAPARCASAPPCRPMAVARRGRAGAPAPRR